MFPKLCRDVTAAGMIFTSIIPDTSRWFIFLPLMIIWLLSSFMSNMRGFLNVFVNVNLKAYSVYAWMFSYFTFYISGYMAGEGVESHLANYMRFGFSILLFNYYIEANDDKAIRRLALFSIGCIVFTCIMTLHALFLNPMAARLLSTGREDAMEGLTGMMTGNYGFIYGLAFLSIAVCGSLTSGLITQHKLVFALLLSLFAFTIFQAAFMFALLLVTIVSALLLLNVRGIPRLGITTLALTGLCLLLSPAIYDICVYLGDIVANEALSQRFHEIAFLVRDGNLEGTDNAAARFDLYALSFRSFLSSPIIGIGGYYGLAARGFGIGGHSAFLDALAGYGTLGSACLFVALLSNATFVYNRFDDSKQKLVYSSCMLAFFILGVINTLLFAAIAIMAYFVVPSLLYTVSQHEKTRNGGVTKLGTKHNEHPLVRQHSAS